LIGVVVSGRSLTIERIRACDNVPLSRTAVCAGEIVAFLKTFL